MTRTTSTSSVNCPRCYGDGTLLMGPDAVQVVCPDCRGTGYSIVKEYPEWAVAQAIAAEREACAKALEDAATEILSGKRVPQAEQHGAYILQLYANRAIRARGKT